MSRIFVRNGLLIVLTVVLIGGVYLLRKQEKAMEATFGQEAAINIMEEKANADKTDKDAELQALKQWTQDVESQLKELDALDEEFESLEREILEKDEAAQKYLQAQNIELSEE